MVDENKELQRQFSIYVELHGKPKCPKCETNQIQLVRSLKNNQFFKCRHCVWKSSEGSIGEIWHELN